MFSWEPQLIASLENDNYSEALARLEELQNREIDDSERRCILLYKASCLVELNELDQARSIYETLRKNPDMDANERYLVLLGESRCLEKLGEFREARRCLNEIQRIDTNDEHGLTTELVEINIQFAERKLTEAINHATSFLNLHAEELSQQENERDVYELELTVACERVNAAQFREAIDSLKAFLLKADKEDHARLQLFLGLAYEGLKERDKAVDAFKEVLHLPSTDDVLSRAHLELGIQYLKKGSAAWAKQHLLQAENLKSALNVPLKDLYLSLANACKNLGENEEKERYSRLAKQF